MLHCGRHLCLKHQVRSGERDKSTLVGAEWGRINQTLSIPTHCSWWGLVKLARSLWIRRKAITCLLLKLFSFCTADFLGCYKDDKAEDENFRLINPRALGFQIQRFSSVQDCADQCASKGFLYAGLQNGDLCFCGNDFDKYGRAHDSECNIKCRTPDEKIMITDNAFESCGGRWRNAVYAGKYGSIFLTINSYITQVLLRCESVRLALLGS